MAEMSAQSNPSTQTEDILKQLADERRAKVQAQIDALAASFDAAVKAGDVQYEADQLEDFTIRWTPADQTWTKACSAALAVLAKKTGMQTAWNGCEKCPIVFRPRPKEQPAVTAAQIGAGLKAMREAMRGEASPTDADYEKFGEVVKALFSPLSRLMGGGVDDFGLYDPARAEDSECAHVQHHAPMMRIPRRGPVTYAGAW